MTRYRYSLDRRDAKLAGVCSALGTRLGVDPTFIRVAWIAVPLLTPITFLQALIAYAVVGVVLAVQKARSARRGDHCSEFERMADSGRVRPSVKAVRELDTTDRKLMAIDHHLNSHNDQLAREIEALREEK